MARSKYIFSNRKFSTAGEEANGALFSISETEDL